MRRKGEEVSFSQLSKKGVIKRRKNLKKDCLLQLKGRKRKRKTCLDSLRKKKGRQGAL